MGGKTRHDYHWEKVGDEYWAFFENIDKTLKVSTQDFEKVSSLRWYPSK